MKSNAIHTMVLPDSLESKRLPSKYIGSYFKALDWFGFKFVSLERAQAYIILNKKEIESTGRLNIYSSKEHIKFIVGKQGSNVENVKRHNPEILHLQPRPYEHLHPKPREEWLTPNQDGLIVLDRDYVNMIPLDCLVNIGCLYELLQEVLTVSGSDISMLVNDVRRAYIEHGALVGTRAAIKLVHALEDTRSVLIRNIVLSYTDKQYNSLYQTLFTEHWNGISVKKYPIIELQK